MSSRSSKKTTSDQTVEVGRVHAAHGVRGEVSVEPYSEVEGRFAPGAEVLARRRDLGVEPLTVEAVRPHKARLLIRFAGVTDRDAAEALRGTVLEVPREDVPAPPEDTWYYFQLVGCRCHDAREGDLGEVVDVLEDGGGVLLDVRESKEGGRRLLIPFVKALVRSVEPTASEGSEGGRIELELPEGLVEACASKS
jgi:16S rRNA processing protein RimM